MHKTGNHHLLMNNFSSVMQKATYTLQECSDTPRLDAECLLAFVLNQSRLYLFQHPQEIISPAMSKHFFKLVELRKKGIPIAYLTREKEFWSLAFQVTKDTLVPRAETELLVEIVVDAIQKEKYEEQKYAHSAQLPPQKKTYQIADLGTGCGAIACVIAYEFPDAVVHATDFSPCALEIAKQNIARLKLQNVFTYLGNWCAALPKIRFDWIISNPPYLSDDSPYLVGMVEKGSDLRHEPESALAAGADGLSCYREILKDIPEYLSKEGTVLFEHGETQSEALADLCAPYFKEIHFFRDNAGRPRAICARFLRS